MCVYIYICFFIGVYLSYNVLGVLQNDPYIYIFCFSFFSIIGYYKIVNIVPCAVGSCGLPILYIVVCIC